MPDPRRVLLGARNHDFELLHDPLGYDFPVLRSRPRPLWRSIICFRCVVFVLTIGLLITIIAAGFSS